MWGLAKSELEKFRYEVNPEFVKQISEKGLKFVGEDVDGERMEIVELEGHPFFVGLQAWFYLSIQVNWGGDKVQ